MQPLRGGCNSLQLLRVYLKIWQFATVFTRGSIIHFLLDRWGTTSPRGGRAGKAVFRVNKRAMACTPEAFAFSRALLHV